MKNQLHLSMAMALFAGLGIANAQLTWDVVPGDNAITPGTGTWDTATGNWTADGGTNNIAWVNGSDAQFTESGYLVNLGSGVTVGGITHAGTGPITIQALVDNTVLTVDGSPTWNLNNRRLNISNNTTIDTALAMGSGQTLTVTGTGTFDTGENPTDALWDVGGSTLDFQAAELRGNINGVGRFNLVKMAGGGKYFHERNQSQTYANNWELGAGTVKFDNRFSKVVTLAGTVSGAGTLQAEDMGAHSNPLNLTGPNTFTGGVVSDGTLSETTISITSDQNLGAVPGAFDPDNIVLRNLGALRLNAVTLHANRGITLDGGGAIVLTGTASTYGGKITGTGGLQIGESVNNFGNILILTSNTHDYTGGTTLYRGTIQLGIDNAIPTNSVLTIGGSNTSRLDLNGFNQTVAGLASAANNTRDVRNNGPANSTLTMDVATGQTYGYIGNFSGTAPIHIVKTGPGTQRLTKTGAYTVTPASIAVDNGVLEWKASGSGPVTVGANGTLGGSGTNGATVVSGGLAPGGVGLRGTLTFASSLDISAVAAANAGGLQFEFATNNVDRIVVSSVLTIGSGQLGFADFDFTDVNGVTGGVYTLFAATSISGSLNPADLTGNVGTNGATGTLSMDGTGILITIIGGDTSAFGQWAASYDLVGDDAAEDADPDMDNYNNLQEFAFGGNPTNSAVAGTLPSYGKLVQGGTNYFKYVYAYRTGANPGVTYELQTTSDLVYGTWTNAGYTVLGTGVINAEFSAQTNGIPLDASSKYFIKLLLEKQ